MFHLSKETMLLLGPLPPLSSFPSGLFPDGPSENPPCQVDTVEPTSKKKRRRMESTATSETQISIDIASEVDAIRRDGMPADTLFFPNLPPELAHEAALRAAVVTPVREMKILHHGKSGGKALAWAAFFNEADCVATLRSLRQIRPSLKARLHKPKAGGGTAGPSHHAPSPKAVAMQTFNTRADKIIAEGGLADTIMLRGLPLDVTEEEVVHLLTCLFADGPSVHPVRTRSCEATSGHVRNFWLTFGSRADAGMSFAALMGHHATFRCGKSMRIVPVVHNDVLDADAKKRRQRTLAMVTHDEEALNTSGRVPTSNCGRICKEPSLSGRMAVASPPSELNGLEKLERLTSVLQIQSNHFEFD